MDKNSIEISLPIDVVCRLLRERSLTASEFHCLNNASLEASHRAIKLSAMPATSVKRRKKS